MSIHNIQSEVIDIQGIYTLAVYVHYFLPGSLKIQSKVYTVPLGQLRELIDDTVTDPLRFENTRRWLPKGEAPYPGYCRAPGSARCIPVLCNCQKLKDVWNTLVLKKVALNQKIKLQKKSIQLNQTENKDLKTKETKRTKKGTNIKQIDNKDLKTKGTKRTKKKGHKHVKQTKS